MSEPQHIADPPAPSELPPPSAEIVLLRVFASAYLTTVSRKKGDAFLRAAAEILRDEESLAAVMPIRGASQAAAVSKARRGAIALFRALTPTFLGRLGPK
ncbi:hypothetical protein [Phenylobacterium sp.]|uniref:hypothetical protein n=1 Tax=Phenylobacterium sp. TaxID=1871053 RepID=UPI002FCC4E46